MDKKLSRTINVLEALQSYFDSLKDFVKVYDRSKFVRLEHNIEKCSVYRTKFIDLSRKTFDAAGYFEIVALWNEMTSTIKKVYDDLDFQLPIGEEISKTRAYRLTDVFNKVTTVYRLYVRDLGSQTGDIVDEADRNLEIDDPKELQSLWQKFPASIDLYTKQITKMLNLAYKTGDRAKTTKIFELLDQDKRFILEESEWISPFLTFNCVPQDPRPTEFSKVAQVAGLKINSVKDFRPDRQGLIIVSRQTHTSLVHLMPKNVEWGPGITKEDVFDTLKRFEPADWEWSVDVRDARDTEEYLILETLGSDAWRILTPWKFPAVWIRRDALIEKIKQHAFGRPDAYHKEIDNAISRIRDTRVAHLIDEAARPADLGLNVLRVTDALVQFVKKLRGPATDRLMNEGLDKIFETAILEELHPKVHLLDALLYWTEWTRRDFRKELDLKISKSREHLESRDWDASVEDTVRTLTHDVVAGLLKKSDNIFQDLFDKQHKLEVIKQFTR